MENKKNLVLMLILSLSGCQTLAERDEQRREQNHQMIAGSYEPTLEALLPLVDIKPEKPEDFFTFNEQQRNEYYRVVSTDIFNEQKFIKVPILLTPELYDPDARSFKIPLSYANLNESGLLINDYDDRVEINARWMYSFMWPDNPTYRCSPRHKVPEKLQEKYFDYSNFSDTYDELVRNNRTWNFKIGSRSPIDFTEGKASVSVIFKVEDLSVSNQKNKIKIDSHLCNTYVVVDENQFYSTAKQYLVM